MIADRPTQVQRGGNPPRGAKPAPIRPKPLFPGLRAGRLELLAKSRGPEMSPSGPRVNRLIPAVGPGVRPTLRRRY